MQQSSIQQIFENVIPAELHSSTLELSQITKQNFESVLNTVSNDLIRIITFQNEKFIISKLIMNEENYYISTRLQKKFKFDPVQNLITDVEKLEAEPTSFECLQGLSWEVNENNNILIIANDMIDERNQINSSLRVVCKDNKAEIKLQSHILENGNIQFSLVENVDVQGDLQAQAQQIQKEISKIFDKLEAETENTVKGARRVLPICGQKINWEFQ
ncbi:Conserved_hypothetical protein [Hexamita inflata]|uniref:F-actin-capping protein subunit alpha n=1 Tax=Hexamita inflata TaxID=28002 RepID=A0AA86Q8X4_9EUKA|nr:Conserved hypothetical protein [Hexamita inflata]